MHVKSRQRMLSSLLVATIMLLLSTRAPTTSGSASDTEVELTYAPKITLRAASGASILYKAQDGPLTDLSAMDGRQVPHLVLHRSGTLTKPEERALIVELSGIQVPPPGVTVTLHIETQHEEPDPAQAASPLVGERGPTERELERRIPVWREAQWIANSFAFTATDVTVVFKHTFDGTVMSGTETIATPTDYFRYDLAVIHSRDDLSYPSARSSSRRSASLSWSRDYAFLMENQWIARLPEVREASLGAAPDELVIYYYDMVPFQRDDRDPATWLAREDVPDYVRSELAPRMVEAFRVQTDDWGFPWYEAWVGYRRGEDAERLSVALSDGRTWYHGRAPLRANSAISIRVTGGDNKWYDTLTDGLMSSFHHELFHHLQRNINLHYGGDGAVAGAEDTWRFFSEGTAVLSSSMGVPDAQFRRETRSYAVNANRFLGYGGLFNDLNTSYEEINPYHAAIYWRFLYEQCGGATDGNLEPAAGMEIIRRALTVLYSGEVVDVGTSIDLVGSLAQIMDRALSASSCPFDTYAESLAAFTRAVYALQMDSGRCVGPGIPAGCGFYDPFNVYSNPPVDEVTLSGGYLSHAGTIPSSYGVDFVEVLLDPAADGRPLMVEVQRALGTVADFTVEVWPLKDQAEGTAPRPAPTSTASPRTLKATDRDGASTYTVPAIDTMESNRLGLIITRVDANEGMDPVGAYTIVMR